MKLTKNVSVCILALVFVFNWGSAIGQLDKRFGAGGVEGTQYLGQEGLEWYRDWHDSYLVENYPQPPKNKFWTVGKIDYRTDGLGMDWKWILLDLLEDTNIDLLENFLNLSLAVVNQHIMPMIDEFWVENKPIIEDESTNMLNNFEYVGMKYRIKYKAFCRNTDIQFQDELPEFNLVVKDSMICFDTTLTINWKTHIYIKAWVLNPNPFRWGYHWKSVGDADCDFKTTVNISGNISIEGQGRDRHFQVNKIASNATTESDIDWSLLGISFTWNELSNSVENVIDEQIEKLMNDELKKEPITTPYYFVEYFKSLFPNEVVHTQQEILDQIFEGEKEHIKRVIEVDKYTGEYWSIGNEPNWSPLFEPEQYAEYFLKYYRLIKELDPSAKIIGPSIFLTELIENPGDIAFLLIPAIFKGLLTGIDVELKNLVVSYFQKADSKEWYNRFINHLPGDVNIDVNDMHIFPMNAENTTVDWDKTKLIIDEMAAYMKDVSESDDIWISEFGNMDWRRSVTEVAAMCRNFCQYFKANEVGIKKWFWFLSTGHTPFFDLPITPRPPVTALLKNNLTLTPIGEAYLQEADNTPPIIASDPVGEGGITFYQDRTFHWEEAKEYDTGIIDYEVQVRSLPGNKIIYADWIGNKTSFVLSKNYLQPILEQLIYLRIRAKNGAGLISDWSDWSNGLTVRYWFANKADKDFIVGDSDPEKETNQNLNTNENDENSSEDAEDVFLTKQSANFTSYDLPDIYELSQNFPNPFNMSTNINYQLPEAGNVMITIYNIIGKEISTIVDEYKAAGYYSFSWRGDDLVSGIYVYRIKVNNFIDFKKCIIMK